MSLWAHKYRPRTLSDLTFHAGLTEQLARLSQSDSFPHLLVYGPSGAGKKTRVMATLRELFGASVDKVRQDTRTVTTPSNKSVEVSLLVSNHHMEINPTDLGNNDRVVMQKLIKEMAMTQNIEGGSRHRFKVVIVSEADALSPAAQHALRRTMEKYMRNLRIILCANSISKIIPAVRSRCLMLRVPAPSSENVMLAVRQVLAFEAANLQPSVVEKAVAYASGNVRRALLGVEAMHVTNAVNPDDILRYDWESYIEATAIEVLRQQTPEQLLVVRAKLYELLSHCIPSTIIFKTLASCLASRVDEAVRPKIYQLAAEYEYSSCLGTKPIYHLEAFVAKVMSVYRKHSIDAMM